ncbi:MAG: response regulator [Bryobacteraceae bacterium]|nr:response regulator [Bryobacteraceae bacterium]
MPKYEGTNTGRACDLLVIDDDAAQVDLFRHILVKLGLPHRCYHAAGGAQALDFLHAKPPYEGVPRPDIILLDLNMPGLDGREVLKRIKTDPDFKTIPVIVFSHSSSDSEINAAYGERANAYVGKPEDIESNINLLRELDRFWLNIAQLPD